MIIKLATVYYGSRKVERVECATTFNILNIHIPEEISMKLFLDTADISEIEKYSDIIYGVTTTPTIIKRTHGDFRQFITSVRLRFPELEIHIEAMGNSAEKIREQVFEFTKQDWYDQDKIVFKIPIDLNGLTVCKKLKIERPEVKINLHMAFSVAQAILAMSVEPDYIAPLIGRYSDNISHLTNQGIRGQGADPGHHMLKNILSARKSLASSTEILVSSTRTVYDLEQAVTAGADVITVPPRVIKEGLRHDFTDSGVAEFARDL